MSFLAAALVLYVALVVLSYYAPLWYLGTLASWRELVERMEPGLKAKAMDPDMRLVVSLLWPLWALRVGRP